MLGKGLSTPSARCHFAKEALSQRNSHALTCHAAAVGIDLGTTNSAVAVFKEGDPSPRIIRDATGATIIPSVVAYDKHGGVLVGRTAKRQAVANPLNTFYSIKRLIGRQYSDIEQLPTVYRTRAAVDGSVELPCPARGAALAPEEVSAQILKHLLSMAEEETGEGPITAAVITVPAYFTPQQRQATLEAAHMAGLQQVHLLQEPVAAALAFGFGKAQAADTLLVVDLGGGTYDVSVLESFEGIMEVLATNGDPQLGGDDYDSTLVDWLLTSQLAPDAAAQVLQNPATAAMLFEAVESVKVKLSSQKDAALHLPFLLPVSSSSISSPVNGLDLTLTRGQLEGVTQGLRRRLWGPLKAVAADAKLAFDLTESEVEAQLLLQPQQPLEQQQQQGEGSSSTRAPTAAAAAVATAAAPQQQPVDKYAPKPRLLTAAILVGGATRMPSVQKFVRQLTGLQPRSEVDPECCVALGAAIQAGLLQGLTSNLEIMDGGYVMAMHGRASGIGGSGGGAWQP